VGTNKIDSKRGSTAYYHFCLEQFQGSDAKALNFPDPFSSFFLVFLIKSRLAAISVPPLHFELSARAVHQ
jgi:hypothetical protein